MTFPLQDPANASVDCHIGLSTVHPIAPRFVHVQLSPASPFGLAQVHFLLRSCAFTSLQQAADTMVRLLMLPPAEGHASTRASVRVTLACDGQTATGQSDHEIAPQDRETQGFGTVDVVEVLPQAGVYRLNIGPGLTIPPHFHAIMQEHELVLHDGLLRHGDPVAAGDVTHWKPRQVHDYLNPTERWLCVLCVDKPRFIPDDEVLISP